MLRKGLSLSQVSQILGHDDIQVTANFYGQFGLSHLQKAFDEYSDI
jgi:site-specific recombinase XerD